jgi:adenosylhomocysteine nucleosidase
VSDDLRDNAHAEIAVVCALALELAPLLDRCQRPRKTIAEGFVVHGAWLHAKRVALLEAGNRTRALRRATTGLIDAHSPELVVAAGLAGALSDDLAVGHFLVADEITATDGTRLAVDGARAFAAGASEKWSDCLHVGRLLTVDHIVRTADEKRALHRQQDALAVDMESLIVAQVCRERGVRFQGVRVISDDAATDLPPEVLSLFGASKFFRLGAALGAAWHRPAAVKDLWQLRDRAHQAAERLAELLDELLGQSA